MHRTLIHGLIAIICLGLGAGGALWIVQGRPQPPESDLPGPRPVPVDWRALSVSEVPREVTGTGTLRAAREVRLAFEFGGRIASVWPGLADGIAVPRGTELVSLDVGPLNLEIQAQQTAVELAEIQGRGARSDLERAAAAVEIARERLQLLADEEERWRSLTAEGRSERARLDLAAQARLSGALGLEEAKRGEESSRSRALAAEKEVRLARDRIAILEDRRDRSALRAPFDGRFSLAVPSAAGAPGTWARALPEPGDALGPLEPVGTLLDTTSLLLTCDVHEDDIGTVFVGAAAALAPHARPGLLLDGRVTAVGARVDPVLRSVPVEVAFGGTSEKSLDLPAGSFARVEIQARPARGVLFVEESWVAYRGGRAVVFAVDDAARDGRPVARARRITFMDGIHSGGRIVTSGLEPGARVITSSLELIGDGTELILR